tara:strand:- start:505 stop:681 length:177 start_codon:yes stop_codon:yes gene_type:complete
MKTLRNTTKTKAVNIITDGSGRVRAMYVQIYKGQEQVLDCKDYSTIKRAEKWAESKLS